MQAPTVIREGYAAPCLDVSSIAAQVQALVYHEYPFRQWEVEYRKDGGVVIVKEPTLSKDVGVVLRLPDILTHDGQRRMVREHCGQLIERYTGRADARLLG